MARTRLSLLLLLLVGAVYAGSLSNGFHLDDFHSIVNNPHIRDPAAIPGFFLDAGAFSVNPGSAMYRPLLLSSFALDRALFGDGAGGHHAVNVLLHAATAIALLWWLHSLGLTLRLALMAALLFALHPINSEAVCYISSRSEVLMGLGLLGAALAHSRFQTTRRAGWLYTGVGLTAASLLSKSVGIVTPAAVALADAFRGGWRRVCSGWQGYAALAAPCLIYVLLVRSSAARALIEAPVRSPASQWWTQIKAQVYYLQLLAMPAQLNVEHQFDVARGVTGTSVLAGLLLLSIGLCAWRLRRVLRCLLLGVAWWAVVLLPTTVIPLIVLVNEHRLYVASMGALLPVAWSFTAFSRQRGRQQPMAAVVPVLYTIVLALLTLSRIPDWRDEVTLWTDAAHKAPLMVRPHLRLADALVQRGELAAAEVSYLRAVELRPAHVASRNNLGLFYRTQGRLAEAQAQFQALLAASPDNIPARLNLAEIELMRGRWQQAWAHYDTARSFADTRGLAQLRMGQIALQFMGDADLALTHFDAAIAAGAETDADAHVGRGVALRALGDNAGAVQAYNRAIAVAPGRADVWYNLGNLHLAAGEPAAAGSAFERVITLGDDPELVRMARRRLQDTTNNTIDTDN